MRLNRKLINPKQTYFFGNRLPIPITQINQTVFYVKFLKFK